MYYWGAIKVSSKCWLNQELRNNMASRPLARVNDVLYRMGYLCVFLPTSFLGAWQSSFTGWWSADSTPIGVLGPHRCSIAWCFFQCGPHPAAEASHGNLLEMQILGFLPRPTELERSSNLCFNKLSRWFWEICSRRWQVKRAGAGQVVSLGCHEAWMEPGELCPGLSGGWLRGLLRYPPIAPSLLEGESPFGRRSHGQQETTGRDTAGGCCGGGSIAVVRKSRPGETHQHLTCRWGQSRQKSPGQLSLYCWTLTSIPGCPVSEALIPALIFGNTPRGCLAW
jgi:hypothetical protein